jgi:hypothetical protein
LVPDEGISYDREAIRLTGGGPMRTSRFVFAFPCFLALGVVGCGGRREGRIAVVGRRDPCALLARAEAEQVLGPLRHDPYRVNRDGGPAADGTACRFETTSGRHLVMDVSFDGAQIGMRVIGLGAQLASPVFGSDSARIAALQGTWEEVRLLPGHLMARKGDAMVDLDYEGSGADLGSAARLASQALQRLGSPLPYDGSAAARTAPGAMVTPRDPCTLVTRAEAEAIIGALASDPVSDSDQTACSYTLAARRGLGGQVVQLTVQWRDGFAALAGARDAAALVQQRMGIAIPLDSQADSGFKQAMQPIQGLMRAQGIGVQMSDTGLVSDSAIAGPWDEASLIAGVTFNAVKHDVMLSLDLRTVPYEQARALLAKAMERL